MAKKKFQELQLCDAFLFSATMTDPELCRMMLERILGFSIERVVVKVEENLFLNPEQRGVRLDVYASDENHTMYNVEMQTADKKNLPKRSRLYQAEMDAMALKPGEDFNKLPGSYVIFICTFDLFARGRFRYTFWNQCGETGQALEDGAVKIFLNTQGKNPQDVPKELTDFLGFVERSDLFRPEESEDEFLVKMYNRIQEIKRSRRWEEGYMLFGELLDDERLEGRKEGRRSEREELLHLIEAMAADGRTEEIPKLSQDEHFLEEIKKVYKI